MTTPLRVPSTYTGRLRKAVEKLGLAEPIFIPRVNNNWAAQGMCFPNAQQAVAFEGGQVLMGWALRMWPRCFLEAEQHAVWQQPSGDIVDVTPHPYDATTVFSCDTQADFSENGLANRINRYVNIAEGKLRAKVDQLLSASAEKMEYELAHKSLVDGALHFSDDESERQRLLNKMSALAMALPKKRWS